MTPLVSILIPCHNAKAWLSETLESALGQSWPNCEIIVVDDGSTDDSVEVATSYLNRGIALHRQSKQGAAAARNYALSKAQGDYIQFLDADDLLGPDKISRQLQSLNLAPAGRVATASWGRFHHDPAKVVFNPEPVWCDAKPLDWLVLSWSGGGMMHPAAWLLPKSVAQAAGPWNETLSLDDDGEYFTRVVLASTGVIHSREARVYYRTHLDGSLSQQKSLNAWQSSHEVCRLVQKHVLIHENSPRVRRACALNHLRFAFHAWPYPGAQKFASRSLEEAYLLDPTTPRPILGARFEMLAKLMGWKRARILQHFWHHV